MYITSFLNFREYIEEQVLVEICVMLNEPLPQVAIRTLLRHLDSLVEAVLAGETCTCTDARECTLTTAEFSVPITESNVIESTAISAMISLQKRVQTTIEDQTFPTTEDSAPMHSVKSAQATETTAEITGQDKASTAV